MSGLGLLARAVAAARARESERAEPLFVDPYAARLAGEEGRELLARIDVALAVDPSRPDGLARRTRFFDELLLRATGEGDVRQVVLLGAGMDARALRLPFPPDTRVFELDAGDVLAEKERLLAQRSDSRPESEVDGEPVADGSRGGPAPPSASSPAMRRCRRIAVPTDLAREWDRPLVAAGFTRDEPTAWLAEGLLAYLDPAAVDCVLRTIDSLSAAGSRLGVDVLAARVLEHPAARPMLAFFAGLGAPMRFGSDGPAALLGMYGWSAKAEVTGRDGARPMSYFVTAKRRASATKRG